MGLTAKHSCMAWWAHRTVVRLNGFKVRLRCVSCAWVPHPSRRPKPSPQRGIIVYGTDSPLVRCLSLPMAPHASHRITDCTICPCGQEQSCCSTVIFTNLRRLSQQSQDYKRSLLNTSKLLSACAKIYRAPCCLHGMLMFIQMLLRRQSQHTTMINQNCK